MFVSVSVIIVMYNFCSCTLYMCIIVFKTIIMIKKTMHTCIIITIIIIVIVNFLIVNSTIVHVAIIVKILETDTFVHVYM